MLNSSYLAFLVVEMGVNLNEQTYKYEEQNKYQKGDKKIKRNLFEKET